jgi:hypothetical protein
VHTGFDGDIPGHVFRKINWGLNPSLSPFPAFSEKVKKIAQNDQNFQISPLQ